VKRGRQHRGHGRPALSLRSLAILAAVAVATYAGGTHAPPLAAAVLPEASRARQQDAQAPADPAVDGGAATTNRDAPGNASAEDTAGPLDVAELADRYSARYGLDDPKVLRALIQAESRGDARAVTRTAREWSVGLLQANRLGGRGVGYSEAQLQDPELNLALGMPEIADAYREAYAAGYRGAPLAVRVAELAQRPDPATLHRFADAYEASG
jgi:soluble lytic murein transglycosylase-like protein